MNEFFGQTKVNRKKLAGVGMLILMTLAVLYYLLYVAFEVRSNFPQIMKEKLVNIIQDDYETTAKIIAESNPFIGAYLVGGDKNSITSLNNNLDKIDVLLPVWLSLEPKDQSLKRLEQKTMISLVKDVKQKKPELKIVAVINNYRSDQGKWDAEGITTLLNDSQKEEKLIAEIVNFLGENSLDGVSVDFESIKKEDQERYVQFLANLSSKFKDTNYSLSVSLPLVDEKYNYKKIAEIVDEVILMAYDQHWATGTPGPIASQKWFEMELQKISKQIPSDKLVIGLASYAYDWPNNGKTAKTMSYDEARKLAEKMKAEIKMDQENLNNYFEYDDGNHTHHLVYLLDQSSVFNEKRFGDTILPKGYTIWRIGSEDSELWSVFDNKK